MGRKKTKNKKKDKVKKDKDNEGFVSALKKETAEGIWAIIFIIVAIFLILAKFEKAGLIGNVSYAGLSFLFGIGYYLLPVILLILGISFIKSLSHNLAWPKLLGAGLMLLAGLGLIDLLVDQGGVIGRLINIPLLALLGQTMSYIIHIGVVVISVLIIFDLSLKAPHITNWFSRNSESEEDDDLNEEEQKKMDELMSKNEEDSESDEDNYSDDEEVEIVAPPTPQEPAKKPSGLVFLSKKSSGFKEYKAPPLSLLEKDSGKPGVGDIKANANMIKRTLANFGIQVEMDEVSIGPSVTRYALKPAEGVKLSRIVALQTDLALALAAKSIRIEAPIPGKSLVGIEIPNSTKTRIGLGSILKDEEYQKSENPLVNLWRCTLL
jgi:S-DNA-T family DNA segregation ATPase FtsK/SpoIIIE